MSAQLPRKMPPIGGDPSLIAAYINGTIWDGYKYLRRPWLRQIEQNVRALAGQQYDEYLETAGQFVNVAAYFLPEDERWRRSPVFNWLKQTWFISALAKLTENIPVLGALPASADESDAKTAAIFDPFFRYQWSQMGMPEKMFDLYGWLLTAGEAVLMLRWDPDRGHREEFFGPTSFDVDSGRPQTQAPYVRQGDSFAPALLPDPDTPDQPLLDPEGRPVVDDAAIPYSQPIGDFACDVLCPATCLWPYGPEPYYEKPWFQREYFMNVVDIEAKFGVVVSPDVGPTTGTDGSDTLRKFVYSSPYLHTGSWGSPYGGFFNDGNQIATMNMARVRERWERACPEYPYGRLTIVTASTGQLLYDDINPYVIPGVRNEVIIPFFRFRKPDLPFRQEGSSDLESLNPVARALNRSLGGMLDYADHNEQPTKIYNRNLFADDQIDNLNRPGGIAGADGDPRAAIFQLQPPTLPDAVSAVPAQLRGWLEILGNTGMSTGGNAVTPSASGELQREVRFDADRPWGATLRLNSFDWARVGQTLIQMAAVCLDDDRVLAIAGDDQALTFVTVQPTLFQGRINVQAMPESYVMETRADKQARVKELIAMGLPPEQGFRVLGYPDVNRALRPGGEAYALAQRLVAQMVQTGQMVPVLPEHNHPVFIAVAKDFQQTLTYLNLPPETQALVRTFIQMHQLMGAQEQLQQAQLQAGVQGAVALTGVEAGAPAQRHQAKIQQETEPMVTGAPQRGPSGKTSPTGLPQ